MDASLTIYSDYKSNSLIFQTTFFFFVRKTISVQRSILLKHRVNWPFDYYSSLDRQTHPDFHPLHSSVSSLGPQSSFSPPFAPSLPYLWNFISSTLVCSLRLKIDQSLLRNALNICFALLLRHCLVL